MWSQNSCHSFNNHNDPISPLFESGLPWNLLWPVECYRNDAVWLLRGLEWVRLSLSQKTATCEQVQPSPWTMRHHVERERPRHPTHLTIPAIPAEPQIWEWDHLRPANPSLATNWLQIHEWAYSNLSKELLSWAENRTNCQSTELWLNSWLPYHTLCFQMICYASIGNRDSPPIYLLTTSQKV